MSKAILITGGAGFIGANFVPYLVKKYPSYHIINLDKLTYAGDLSNLSECQGALNYTFVQGDICDKQLVQQLFSAHDIRGVIHFAAESHVDNSIQDPSSFITTNVNGTYTLIDAAYHHWMEAPHKVKPSYEACRFHHISTDEVYGSLGKNGYFTERTPYAPNSPYSASKAGSDFIVRAYHHTFGLNVTTSNCSNNYGPKQHSEKLIPTIIRSALQEKPIPIYGTGNNVRDWLYVMDHCRAIDLIFHQAKAGETYNIGGHNEKTNLEIAHLVCAMLNKMRPRPNGRTYADLITLVTDRAGHDFRYAIDASKISSQLGWTPSETFESGLEKTLMWYLSSLSK